MGGVETNGERSLQHLSAVAPPAQAPAPARAAGGKWCILRTSGPKTLPLARSLVAAGFDVWTPRKDASRRRPRSKVEVEYEAPIVPTFVFARAARLVELLGLASSPIKAHPAFSVFHDRDRIPLIADDQIEGLRQYERRCNEIAQRNRAKAHRQEIPVGTTVSVQDGAWQGLSGIVEGGNGKQARVSFGGSLSVTIATFFLIPSGIEAA